MKMNYEHIRRKALLAARAASFRVRENSGFHPAPLKVKLSVTNRCDLRCRHCNLWSLKKTPELQAADYERFFIRNPYISILSISGGEPFTRGDMDDILEHALKLPSLAILSINTNGYNSDRIVTSLEKIAGMTSGNVKIHVFISVDGPPEVHDNMRGRPGSHERAEKTIAGIRELRLPHLVVWRNVCVSPFNLECMKDYFQDLSCAPEPVNLAFYQYSNRYGHKEEHREMLAGFHDNLVAQMREWPLGKLKTGLLQRRFFRRAMQFYSGDTRGQVIPCFSGAATLIVNPAGEIYPCVKFSKRMGSIVDTECDLRAVLRGDDAVRTRALIRNNRCPSCWTPNEAYISMVCNWYRSI